MPAQAGEAHFPVNIFMLKTAIRTLPPNHLMLSALQNGVFWPAKRPVLERRTGRFGVRNGPSRNAKRHIPRNEAAQPAFSCLFASISIMRASISGFYFIC